MSSVRRFHLLGYVNFVINYFFFCVNEFVGRTKEVDVGEGGCSLWCFVEKNSGLCGGAIEDGVSDVKECVLLTLFLH